LLINNNNYYTLTMVFLRLRPRILPALLVSFVLLLSFADAASKKGKHHDNSNNSTKKASPGKKQKTSKENKGDSSSKKNQSRRTLRVMTYNIWGGGGNEGKPVDETVAVILAAEADIVGVQETRLENEVCDADYCPAVGVSAAEAIATELGFYYYDQTAINDALWANAVISRFPILFSTENDLGVAIDVGDRNTVFAFNIHLTDFPYQPYQLLGIEYGPAPYLDTEKEAVEAADAARGPALELLYSDLKEVGKNDVAFIFGDFNEPSFRDWTKDAAKAGQQPLKVEYPTTKNLEKLGFIDALRQVYPDEVDKPAFTWTPTSEVDDPEDHHDRIDFVFARGKKMRVLDAAIVGEKSPEADIVVTPYPSDHRAVVATVEYDVISHDHDDDAHDRDETVV
jgi:exodeoxyribonuclease III